MRNVADRAGVSLANLQYYFTRRKDLAQAILQDVGDSYRAAYDECLAAAPDSPEERFSEPKESVDQDTP